MAAATLDFHGPDEDAMDEEEFPFDPFDADEVTDLVVQTQASQDDDDEYYRKMDAYLQQVAATLPPAVPPLPAHADLPAQTLRNSKALLRPTPNLLKATFESVHRQSPGELWLKERIAAFDAGNRRKRKEVLEEFLEFVKSSSLFGMEELFSQEAHLFLVRLTSWFSVMLPLLYELPLQLKVFLVFLEFREASIVRNFFESGTVVALMRALATDFDVPDDVRCLAVLVLHRLVLHGRTYKEVLCSKGLISYLVECILDGLKWETIKSAGSLLCELFRSNPNYQSDVMVALHLLLVPTKPALAQRVSLAALAQLVDEDYAGSDWPNQLIPQLLILLEGRDLRVSADSYCLLCSLVRRFRCDTMLWDFARQLNQPQDVDAWAVVEVAAAKAPAVQAPENLAKRLKLQTDAEIVRVSGSGSLADYGASCHEEAVSVLKLSLVMFLVKRSQDLCRELVNKGLTESLLMCLLDVSRPMRQAAVLTELHHLQLLSPHAKNIVETVLVKREMLRALTAEQLMATASGEDLAKARRRLRAMQRNRGAAFNTLKVQHSADEHELQQRILDQQMADSLGLKGPSSNAFLTEPLDTEVEAEKDEAQVPRGGSGCYPVSRVPVGSSSSGPVSRGTDQGAFARGYELEHDIREEPTTEPTVLTALRNVLSEPLTRESAEQSSLLTEVKQLCLSARRPPLQPQVPAQRHEHPSLLKVEERSAQHRRALIMRRAVRRRPMGEASKGSRFRSVDREDETPASEADSEATSLVCVAEAHDTAAMARSAQSVGWERVSSASVKQPRKAGHWPEISVVDTSIGPDMSQEFSCEDVSQDMLSMSHQELSAHEVSMMTTGTAATAGSLQPGSHLAGSQMAASSHAALPEIEEEEDQLRPRVLQSAGLAALVALPSDPVPGKLPTFRKKLLCVAAPPYHNCVAFSSSAQEQADLERVPTSQLLERIAEAGKFPRRWLRKHSTDEAPSSAREHTPLTPRLPPLQPVSARDKPSLTRWQDKLQGLPAHPLNLTEFFPASKRSVDIGSL